MRRAPPGTGNRDIPSLLDWQAAFIENLIEAQRFQLQILAAWQQPCAAVTQELWDQWVARFGGGVPIDG